MCVGGGGGSARGGGGGAREAGVRIIFVFGTGGRRARDGWG